jgi:hypothetical protein
MTTSVDNVPPAAPAPPQARKSAFDRLTGVLFAPSETFADIARKPDILAPLLTIFLIGVVTAVLTAPKFDFESMFREQMANSGRQMSSEDVERALPMMVAFGKTMAYASPLLNLIILAVVAAVMLFAFRIMGGEGTFKQAFSTTLYAWLPLVVYGIIATVVLMSRDSVSPQGMATLVRSNLAFLADPQAQPVLFSLLSSLDIFTIWMLALLSIGFSHVSGFTKGKSAAIVITLWVVFLVFKAGGAMLSSMSAAKSAS